MSQTQLQKPNALRYGSVTLSIGDDFGSLVNIGAIRNMSFEHKVENVEVAFDNVPPIRKFKNGKKASFVFDLAEIDLTTFSKTDAGLVVQSTIAASPVNITDEAVTLSDTKATALQNRHGDGSGVDSLVVSDASENAYTLNTDYTVQLGADGRVYIARIDGGGISDNEEVLVDYSYTPNEAKRMVFNTGGTKTYKVARIVNINNEGKSFQIDLDNVTNIKPLTTPFQADDSDDIMVCSMELEGTVVEIIDEQSIS